ncbi:MAG: hypothetical protein ACXADB_02915 [Candidatus Hermodarchaeia archaeon]|jgi:hypothetical protein
MTRHTFTPKSVSTEFIVRNIAPNRKDIKIFGQKIRWNRTHDLLTIPDVSEADIRHSLLKGELKRKADAEEIRVISSTIDLTQYDSEQQAYLASIGITGGVSPASVSEEQIYYVGKHGNDANDGLTIGNAFLTFGAAVAEAAAQSPTTSNRFVIKCLDNGIYNENILLVSEVDIHAPSATIQGQIELKVNANVKVRRLEIDDSMGATLNAGVLINAPAGAGASQKPARFEADTVLATGNSIGALNGAPNSILIYEVKSTFAENGIGISDGTGAAANGHIHVQCEDIYVIGTGVAIAKDGAGALVGYAAHILELLGGVGNGTGIAMSNSLGAGDVDLQVGILDMTTAYNLAAGCELKMIVNSLSGAAVGAGTAYVTTAGYIAGTPPDWAGSPPTSVNNAIDRLASAVQGLLGGPIP